MEEMIRSRPKAAVKLEISLNKHVSVLSPPFKNTTAAPAENFRISTKTVPT